MWEAFLIWCLLAAFMIWWIDRWITRKHDQIEKNFFASFDKEEDDAKD